MAEKLSEIDKALVQVRRIAEHRQEGSEQTIRKLYKKCLTDLQGFIGIEYAKYANEDGQITYSVLRDKGRKAKFLEEVLEHIDNLTPSVRDEIQTVMESTYKTCYSGMVDAVIGTDAGKTLKKELKALKGINARTVTQSVKNPVKELTLNKVLERHRKDIVYKIKQDITLGISNGDLMPTMARKVAKHLYGDYKKAVNVVRTEGHRVREAATNDAANKSDKIFKEAGSLYRGVKTWRNLGDEAVRETPEANHVEMDGVTVLQDEKFKLSSGALTDHPGASGVAAEDCNCRCYLSYDIMSDEEFFKATGRHFA